MRLINTSTLDLEEFLDSDLPRYGILSHTWGRHEVSLQDYVKTLKALQRGDHAKIRSACQLAKKDGLPYIWIDTCCIDKRSSAELQEAINSMYRYYEHAEKCYVHLVDVHEDCPPLFDLQESSQDAKMRPWLKAFQNSRWFTRGWTLQELIAPKGSVDFHSQKWRFIGSKDRLIKTISEITKIDPSILSHTANVSSMSVAQKMSWAAGRETSRMEDQAYSLLGLFNVNMPMLYGEGMRAFIRLQEEIIRTSTDQSIFAWEFEDSQTPDGSLLAASPRNFTHCNSIVQWGQPRTFDMTNRGLRISLRTLESSKGLNETLAILNCRLKNELSGTLALCLHKYGGSEEYHAMKGYPEMLHMEDGALPGRNRVRYIYESKIPPAMPWKTVQITREFEVEASKLKFWIPRLTAGLEMLDARPRELWDQQDGVMYVAETQGGFRAGVRIKTKSGNVFPIAFGYDRLHKPRAEARQSKKESDAAVVAQTDEDVKTEKSDEQAASDGETSRTTQEHESFLLGLWGSISSHDTALQAVLEQSRQRCNHRNVNCEEHRCPFMHRQKTLSNPERGEKLDITVRATRIFDDLVFVLSFEITPVFELHTVESIIELSPYGTEAVAKVPYLRTDEPRNQLIIASVVPPLLHKLTWEELKAPIQIWVRLPKALDLDEYKGWRHIDHRHLFRGYDSVHAIVSQSLTFISKWQYPGFTFGEQRKERVVVALVGTYHDDWAVLVAGDGNKEARALWLAHHAEMEERQKHRVSNALPQQRYIPHAGMSVSAWFPGHEMWLRVNVRFTSTKYGMACAIDLHFEPPSSAEPLPAADSFEWWRSSPLEPRQGLRRQ